MSDEFYVHEDDWGMIELSPRENYAERQQLVAAAVAHGEAHRAPSGIGWTAIMVAPEVEVKLVTRQITLAALVDVLGPGWRRCRRVTTGYGSQQDECTNAYAFRPPIAVGPWNVVYGSLAGGDIVTSLFVSHCELPIMAELHRLGTRFSLILCDLRRDAAVDLADPVALARYLRCDDSDDE